jgi:hypothetical protein
MKITGWHTSTRSGSQGNCVEVGYGEGVVGVRDTKDRSEMLVISVQTWQLFIGQIKMGVFDQ